MKRLRPLGAAWADLCAETECSPPLSRNDFHTYMIVIIDNQIIKFIKGAGDHSLGEHTDPQLPFVILCQPPSIRPKDDLLSL